MTEEELGPRQKAAETKKRRTRERLVGATVDLYSSESSAPSPTLEEIAEEAGVSLPTLYNHFDTRYELHLAALTQLFEPLVQPIMTAGQLGTYKPDDLRAEIVSYVCRAALLAREYRYLIATYIQAYFESRRYDDRGGGRISQPVALGLQAMINFGRGLNSRFRSEGVADHMDSLLLNSCLSFEDSSFGFKTHTTARGTAIGILAAMLPSVDEKYERSEFKSVVNQIEHIIPKDPYE
jgi:AcrR family transcriptional regulator